MKMSTLKLSDLRKLCKDSTPKGLQKVRDFLEENPGMDLMGEGHGGSIRAAINSDNPEALKALLQYHREHKMDIYEVGTAEYNKALFEFKKVFDEILAENWHFIDEKYIFSDAVKKALDEAHVLPHEDDEQDSVPDIDTSASSSLDCEFDSTQNKRPSGEAHHYSPEIEMY